MINGDRYLRHSIIDWFSQEDISKKKVVVVGGGAIGNEVVKNLALLGVGNIDIFDLDSIEIHNLTRSVLFRESDVGNNKATVVAERARELDPSIKANGYIGDVWKELSLSKLASYDVLLCCVDNFETRIKLNEMCRITGTDMINTGIESRFAVIEAFHFSNEDHACYECGLPASAYVKMSKRYSCAALKKTAFIEKKVPTTIITSSLAGSLAVSIALRLGNKSSFGSRRIMIDSFTGTTTVSELSKNEDCPECGRHPLRPLLLSAQRTMQRFTSINLQVKDVPEDLTLELSDPTIASYRCTQCGESEQASNFIMKCASDFDDSIEICALCNEKTMQIDIRDQYSLGELSTLFTEYKLPCKFVRTTINNNPICIELEGNEL